MKSGEEKYKNSTNSTKYIKLRKYNIKFSIKLLTRIVGYREYNE